MTFSIEQEKRKKKKEKRKSYTGVLPMLVIKPQKPL